MFNTATQAASRLLDRIDKLIRLATNNPSAEEARTAAVQACKLIIDNKVPIGGGASNSDAEWKLEEAERQIIQLRTQGSSLREEAIKFKRQVGTLTHELTAALLQVDSLKADVARLVREARSGEAPDRAYMMQVETALSGLVASLKRVGYKVECRGCPTCTPLQHAEGVIAEISKRNPPPGPVPAPAPVDGDNTARRRLTSKYPGRCTKCKTRWREGEVIWWAPRAAHCESCGP